MTKPSKGVITFADGLPGFEAHRQFVLVASPSLDPFTCVTSVDAGGPSFLAIDPRRVLDGYESELAPADLRRLQAEPGALLVWLSIVTAADEHATVNLRAPLV